METALSVSWVLSLTLVLQPHLKEIAEGVRPKREYINHESIYQFLYDPEQQNQKLWEYLPRRHRKRRRWLGQSRLSKDYERLWETSEALIYAVMSRIMLRRLARS